MAENLMKRIGRWLPGTFFDYDAVQALHNGVPGYRAAHRIVLGVLAVFVLLGAVFIFLGIVDNKPTTASTGLVTAHRMVTMNWSGWFSDGVWWRNKQTPTPLPFTLHGLYFALFGYTVRGILILHTLAGAVLALLLFRITARRHGPWAGLLAMGLCLASPLFLYVTFSGWTFVWATLFLLLAIDLTDRAVIGTQVRWFLLAGFTLGCAGMSRPENYAVSLLMVLFVPFPLRYRAAFLLLVLLYPLAQYAHNNLYLGDEPGLRILEDARSTMGFPALFREWFGSVHRSILSRNYAWVFQWAIVPAVVCFGLPRHRLLTGAVVYFCAAFFAAYAMRRISFNHEGYYFAHVVLFMPFLAAALVWFAGRFAAALRRMHCPPRPIPAAAAAVILGLIAADRAQLHTAYADRLFYRVPGPVRELRDDLVARLDGGDAIALDYFTEVSWMLAEIEGNSGRNAYFYNTTTTGTSRPRVNAARKDHRDEEIEAMNAWVGENLGPWLKGNRPRYVVLLSEAAWEREKLRKNAMGHYRMFGLRPAIAYVRRHGGADPFDGRLQDVAIVFANPEFVVYDLESAPVAAGGAGTTGASPPALNE